jgi:outer membrane receptor protein involved in Fe transport
MAHFEMTVDNYANTVKDDAFWAVNLRYIKKFNTIEVFAVANNIFDEQAIGCASGNPGSESIYPYPGFNMYAGFNVNF